MVIIIEPLILIVDDNEDILEELKILLEFNQYRTLSALNGKEGIEFLSKSSESPNLIISDIMMPEMNGYEFFHKVSRDYRFQQIPFFFLTAKASPEDVRLGEMLGVEDYLTKPFEEKNLLAIISEKLNKVRKTNSINKKINVNPNIPDLKTSNRQANGLIRCSFILAWSKENKPYIKTQFPLNFNDFSVHEVALQLYNAIASIYESSKFNKGENLLLHIENVNCNSYAYLDEVADEEIPREGSKILISVIAPQINYFQSLKLKKIMKIIVNQIKKHNNWDLAEYWENFNQSLE